jgi:hypothetical protein
MPSCKYQEWVKYEAWEEDEIDGRREDEEVELIDERRGNEREKC